MVMGFLRDSRVKSHSVISESPPNIRSVSRIVEGRLARTRQRRTFAMSLNTSKKFIPRARFRIVVMALNHCLRPWLTFPACSKRTRVKTKSAIRPRVKIRRGAWLLKSFHVCRFGSKSAYTSKELAVSRECYEFLCGGVCAL